MNSNEEDDFNSSELNFIQKLETIGSGTYGIVYKGKIKDTEEFIKIELESEGVPSTALREICILRELKHNKVVE